MNKEETFSSYFDQSSSFAVFVFFRLSKFKRFRQCLSSVCLECISVGEIFTELKLQSVTVLDRWDGGNNLRKERGEKIDTDETIVWRSGGRLLLSAVGSLKGTDSQVTDILVSLRTKKEITLARSPSEVLEQWWSMENDFL